jgi:hypothetical protein
VEGAKGVTDGAVVGTGEKGEKDDDEGCQSPQTLVAATRVRCRHAHRGLGGVSVQMRLAVERCSRAVLFLEGVSDEWA